MSDLEKVNPRIVVGETTYTIQRFRGLKAIMAGALVARIMKQMPTLQDDVLEFRQKFMKENSIKVTRAMRNMPQWAWLGLEESDFDNVEGGVIEIPEEPNGQAVFMHIFPDAWELAQAELMRFVALLVIPNQELEAADDADNVAQKLSDIGKQIVRQGTIDEILEILAVGLDVFQEQIMDKRERLGKLGELPFLRMLLSTPGPTTTENTEESSDESTQLTLQEDAPISLEDSPQPTDGPEEKPSTELLGTSSSS